MFKYNLVHSHACGLPKTIQVVTCPFLMRNNSFKLLRKISFANVLSEFIDLVAVDFRFGQTFLRKCI